MEDLNKKKKKMEKLNQENEEIKSQIEKLNNRIEKQSAAYKQNKLIIRQIDFPDENPEDQGNVVMGPS